LRRTGVPKVGELLDDSREVLGVPGGEWWSCDSVIRVSSSAEREISGKNLLLVGMLSTTSDEGSDGREVGASLIMAWVGWVWRSAVWFS